MNYENIELIYQGQLAILYLNRPQVMNSLSVPMAREVVEALHEIELNKEIKALIVTGKGKSFCAGAELNQDLVNGNGISRVGDQLDQDMLNFFNPWIEKIQQLDIPVITALNGVAAGAGVGIALASDITIASESSAFILTFAPKLGLIPDMGSSWQLPRLIGLARAKAVTLLGDKISAAQALNWGMIWDVVPEEELHKTALTLAERLAEMPRHAAKAVRNAYKNSLDNELTEQLDYERARQRIFIELPSFKEGVEAFQQRRKPSFK